MQLEVHFHLVIPVFFNQTIAASTNTRYLRFTTQSIYDVDLDAVTYSNVQCGNLTNTFSGKVYLDANGNQMLDGESGQNGIDVQLYEDTDMSMTVTAGDNLVGTQTTAGDGDYSFDLPLTYDGTVYVARVDETSLPVGASLTTDNIETATFTASGQNATDKNFGITLCGPTLAQISQSDCIDNGTPSTADDYFTVLVLATDNAGNASQKYEVVYNGVVLNPGGTDYGQTVTVGTGQEFSADNSTTYAISIRDFDDNSCVAGFTTTPVAPCAIDLEVTKAAAETIVGVGDDAIFTITVDNKSTTTDASGVQITDLLPAGLTFVSANPSQGTYNDATGLWTVGSLAAGADADLEITATVNTGGFIKNVAEVTAASPEDVDSTPNNDDGDQSEDDEAAVTIFDSSQCADGSLTNNTIKACNDNGTPQVTDDYYTIAINPSGSGTYDIDANYGGVTYNETNVAYGSQFTINVQVPIGVNFELIVTNNGTGNCSFQRVISPAACSGTFTCWAMNDGSGSSYLYKYDSDTNTWTRIGDSGRSEIEAIAYNPLNNTLYTADDDLFGRIDTLTGGWTAIGSGVGTMSGPNGSHNVGDIDGLSYNPTTGIMWASERRAGSSTANDYVFQINLITGDFVPDAFGPGVDYLVVEAVVDTGQSGDPLVYDVDDIAIDPTTGDLYVISNQGGSGGVLTILDKTDGSAKQVIGSFGDVDDMEALGFFNDGLLYGSTGANGPDPGDNNKFYSISKFNGILNQLSPIDASGFRNDFEACDCLTGLPNKITGTVYLDADVNSTINNGETGQAGITVNLYFDTDGDGKYTDGTDVLAETTMTAADGTYSYNVPGTGGYIVRVDESTLPANHVLTTDNLETAVFTSIGQIDENNDFGYAPNNIDLEVTKTVSNATPNVGSTVTFSILVENKGAANGTGIAVQDVVPNGYSGISNISNGGTESGGTISWTGLSIDSQDDITLTFDAVVEAAGNYQNTAQITAADQTDTDSSPNNDDGDQSQDDEDNAAVT